MNLKRASELTDWLRECRVCATGRLATMTHRDLQEFVHAAGGEYVQYPKRGQLLLVVGAPRWVSAAQMRDRDRSPASSEDSESASPTRVLNRAKELATMGYPIEIIAEEEFLDRISPAGAGNPFRQLHTIQGVSRILDVAPATIRRWVKLGMIQPTQTLNRLEYFDFEQIAFARRLWEAFQEGVSIARIRRQLESFRQLWPEATRELSRLTELNPHRILVRTEDGLLDQNRQRYFEFEVDPTSPTPLQFPSESVLGTESIASRKSHVDQLIDEALTAEAAEDYHQASEKYQEAIELSGDDPVLFFNLGNVSYALGDLNAAGQHYSHALELDEDYAEAWNNLGHLQVELLQFPAAIQAFRRALELAPDFDLAQENLNDLIKRMIVQ